MTVTNVGPGDLWQLCTRDGTLIATGTLYKLICLWARLVKDGRSDQTVRHGPCRVRPGVPPSPPAGT